MEDHRIKRKNRIRLYAYVAAVVVIWATAYQLMYYAVFTGGFPPSLVPVARITLPAIAITTYIFLKGEKLPPISDSRWLWYGLMGFLGMTTPFFLLAKGNEMGVESGMSSILTNGVTPLLVILLAHFFIAGEKLTVRKAIGFIIGFIGVVALFLPSDPDLKLISNWQGQGYILLVACSFAIAAVIAKRAPETSASVGAAIMLITAGLTAILMAVPGGVPQMHFSSTVLLAVFILSIVSTGLSDILYLRIIKMSGPSMIGRINYMVPVFAVLFGMIFLGEDFSWRSIAALMIIITGLLVARVNENQN